LKIREEKKDIARIPPGLLKNILPFVFLYKISEKFKSITRKIDIAYKPMNCMNNFIKTGKDKNQKRRTF